MKYLIFLLLCVSCGQTSQDDYVKEEFTLSVTDTLPATVREEEVKTYYSYIVFTTSEPTMLDGETVLVENQYTTEIDSTTEMISDDYKYRILDEAENNLRDAELNDAENDFGKPAKILTRNLVMFESYKEASISRQKTLTLQ